MRVHLVNPSDTSFGVAVITPRWLYVLAQATPDTYGVPLLTDETLPVRSRDASRLATSSASASTRATRIEGTSSAGRSASAARTSSIGGIHSTLYPEEALEIGQATPSSRATAIWSGRR